MKNLTATEVRKLLISLRACSNAREWADGKDLQTIWTTCLRGDWLLWLLGNMCKCNGWPDRKALVSAACNCADLARPYIKTDEVLAAFDHCQNTARKWTRGEATIEEVRAAAYAEAAAAEAAAAYDAARNTSLQHSADIVRQTVNLTFEQEGR